MGMTSDENASRGASSPNSASPGGRGSTGNTTSGRSTGPSSGRQESGSQSRSGNQTSTSDVSYGGGGRNGTGRDSSGGFSGSDGGSNPSGRIGGNSAKSGASRSVAGKSAAGTAMDQSTRAMAAALSQGMDSIGQAIGSALSPMTQAASGLLGGITGGILGTTEEQDYSRFDNLPGNVPTFASTLSRLGWNDTMIAGAIGRLQQESFPGLDTRATRKNDAGPGKHSVGAAQWNRDRLDGLHAYAAEKNRSWDDPEIQAEYIDHEMRTTEKYSWDKMQEAKTPAEAAAAMMHYERPQGYTRSNPTAGHGWKNTEKNANALAEHIGIGTGVAKASAGGPASAATAAVATNQRKGETAAETFSELAGVVGLGGLFDGLSAVASTLNQAHARSQVGERPDGTYVDPSVSTPAGRLARNEATPTQRTQDQVENKRQGLAGIGQALEEGKPGKAVKGIASAVTNPIGFALDTIEDAITNSQAWNTPGPEGEERRFAGGFLDGLLGGMGGMRPTEGNPFAYEHGGSSRAGNANSRANQIASAAPTPVASVDPGLVIPDFEPLPILTLDIPKLPALEASKGISATTIIEPFAWSTL